MYTSIVEFSLISAAVMFIVWRNINHEKTDVAYVKRKHQIRVDCSKTTTGEESPLVNNNILACSRTLSGSGVLGRNVYVDDRVLLCEGRGVRCQYLRDHGHSGG